MPFKSKKILIISMTGGFGHIRAGEALLEYAKENLKNINVEHVDIITIDPSLKKYATKFYDVTSKKFPFVWRMFYEFPPVFLTSKKMIGFLGLFNDKLKQYVAQKNPDIIIFTNIIMLPMLAPTISKHFTNIKMGVVVTDYHGHPYYNFPGINYYFVPSEEVSKDLEALNIGKENIIVTGIPISPKFYIKENIEELKLKYGITNGDPVVLFIASFRISQNDLLSALNQLLDVKPKINIIFLLFLI